MPSAGAPWMSSSCTAEVSAFRIGGIRIRPPIGVVRKILVSSSSAAAALQQKNLKTLEIPNRKNSKSGGFFKGYSSFNSNRKTRRQVVSAVQGDLQIQDPTKWQTERRRGGTKTTGTEKKLRYWMLRF